MRILNYLLVFVIFQPVDENSVIFLHYFNNYLSVIFSSLAVNLKLQFKFQF